ILLDERGDPRIADFGLVRGDDPATLGRAALTATGEIVGTPAFVSPEQVKADAPVTAAADLYSLGATLHALLTGAAPFTGSGRALGGAHRPSDPAAPSVVAPPAPPPVGTPSAKRASSFALARTSGPVAWKDFGGARFLTRINDDEAASAPNESGITIWSTRTG